MKLRQFVLVAAVAAGLPLGGCSTVPHCARPTPPLVQANAELCQARHRTLPDKTRVALYLGAAALANAQLAETPGQPDPGALHIYNDATAELTDLLQQADGGSLWNRPLAITVNGKDYALRFTPQTGRGLWAPNAFTDFKLARKISCSRFHQHYRQEGVGGALVGIQKTPRRFLGARPAFEGRVGLTAPVTATLDFRGRNVALALSDPSVKETVRLQGREQPLAADFTAPTAYYPTIPELWYGLMGLINVDKYMAYTGLYLLHPYDPNRIPVVLVHGLISTPQMWKNVINEMEADPELRGRFQFLAFYYPTGNPPAYSALLCRRELARFQKLHPMPHGCIMIGHSMGGLVSRMQVITTGRTLWDGSFGDKADRFYKRLPPDHIAKQALIFKANPEVKRVVFICVPHRGSGLALGSLGDIGRRLISLPSTLVTTLHQSFAEVLRTSTGKVDVPTSISGLSPRNGTLIAMDKLPIEAPYHSIIGDRGRGDTPNSSDGVVPYWSSHLAGAQSECIVPGPHGSYDLPQTITELKRILREHLASQK